MLGSPTAPEAAAIVAAVEQFIADTAPVPAPTASVNPWQRAALIEGTTAKQAFASPWGEAHPWGARRSRRS